jgi:hypothetical protein
VSDSSKLAEPDATAPAPLIAPRGVPLLWATVVVGAGLLLLAVVRPEPNPKPLEYLTIGYFVGTLFGHATLAATWTAFGPLPLVWRLPLSIGWVAALTIAFAINLGMNSAGSGGYFMVVLGGCLLGQWAIAQLPMWFLAFAYGLRLRHASERSYGLDPSERQFGIRQLMIVTAIVAVVLGIGRMIIMGLLADGVRSGGQPLILVFLAVAGVIMTLPLVLSALLPRFAIPASLLVLFLIAVGTLAELPLLQMALPQAGGGGPDAGHFYGINAIQAAWVLLVIGVLRLRGYGIAAPPTKAAPAEAGAVK